MKKTLKIAGIILAAIVALVAVYVGYMFLSYHRIADMQELAVTQPQQTAESAQTAMQIGEAYSAVTYNIGFGAYTPEYSFFMDGGTSSWGASEESVRSMVKGAVQLVASLAPDFALIQEIDLNSTRSYHINQYDIIHQTLSTYYSALAVNYDSAFLAYPFTEPHGASKSSLALFSRFPITQSVRRSFPISTSITKFFDLDRCFSVSRTPIENGKEFVVFTLHMSAYGNSDDIREGQIRMLCDEMAKEYAAGNYVLCGGDFNHDLKASVEDGPGKVSWAYPFPRESLPEGFVFCIDLLSDAERNAMWDSCRNADIAYIPGETYTVMVDGFIISDNVSCMGYETLNTGYQYSDHEPVVLRFCLLP